jgi:hypothetical protein
LNQPFSICSSDGPSPAGIRSSISRRVGGSCASANTAPMPHNRPAATGSRFTPT